MRALERLAIFVPIGAFRALFGSVLVSRDTRIPSSPAGLGLVIGMAALLGLLGVGKRSYLNGVVGTEIPRDAAAAFFHDGSTTSRMRRGCSWRSAW